MSLKRQLAEEEGFLGRWSRLKREKVEDKTGQEPDVTTQPAASHEPETAKTETEAEPLPDIETLVEGSNFKPFMNPKVAPELRTQALRKLWASNPLYNRIDMLDDYCEDYTDKAVVMTGMKTAYKVGRGFLEKLDELTEQPDKQVAENHQDRSPHDAVSDHERQDQQASLETTANPSLATDKS